jgi:hypothetical protein
MAQSRHYSGIYLEGLRKTMKNLSQNSRCACRNSNRKPPEYKPRDLLLRQFSRYMYVVVRKSEVSQYGYNYQEVSS